MSVTVSYRIDVEPFTVEVTFPSADVPPAEYVAEEIRGLISLPLWHSERGRFALPDGATATTALPDDLGVTATVEDDD